jgi:hypothetical protein
MARPVFDVRPPTNGPRSLRSVEIVLSDWADEYDRYMDRQGRGYRADVSRQRLVEINRGRWRLAEPKARDISEIVFTHGMTVVAVAATDGGVETYPDGRIAWQTLTSIDDDPRIGSGVARSWGNPVRYR